MVLLALRAPKYSHFGDSCNHLAFILVPKSDRLGHTFVFYSSYTTLAYRCLFYFLADADLTELTAGFATASTRRSPASPDPAKLLAGALVDQARKHPSPKSCKAAAVANLTTAPVIRIRVPKAPDATRAPKSEHFTGLQIANRVRVSSFLGPFVVPRLRQVLRPEQVPEEQMPLLEEIGSDQRQDEPVDRQSGRLGKENPRDSRDFVGG